MVKGGEMKQELFLTSVLKHQNQMTALQTYYDKFPNGQSLSGGRSRTQRYPFNSYVVFIYETKTMIKIEAKA